MYYTNTWIIQIHGLYRDIDYTNTWITQINKLHKYIYYKNTWIIQIYESYKFINYIINELYNQIYELDRIHRLYEAVDNKKFPTTYPVDTLSEFFIIHNYLFISHHQHY